MPLTPERRAVKIEDAIGVFATKYGFERERIVAMDYDNALGYLEHAPQRPQHRDDVVPPIRSIPHKKIARLVAGHYVLLDSRARGSNV